MAWFLIMFLEVQNDVDTKAAVSIIHKKCQQTCHRKTFFATDQHKATASFLYLPPEEES
jgi:hypothetical protein